MAATKDKRISDPVLPDQGGRMMAVDPFGINVSREEARRKNASTGLPRDPARGLPQRPVAAISENPAGHLSHRQSATDKELCDDYRKRK